MCGITGVYDFGGESVDRKLLERMTSLLQHRGPDDKGFYVDGNVGLGFRRLSIIDLVTGSQPIHNEDESIWIIFNGEIYNHLDVRKMLEEKGHRYYTKTDTETIVHAYEEYGRECVQHLNGMFAFALWDSKNKTLMLARDRMGIKPLYYLQDKQRIIFASELKSILEDPQVERKINLRALHDYLTYSYVPVPQTIFHGIKKLPQSSTLVCKEGKTEITKYWSINCKQDYSNTESYHCKKIRTMLQESVKMRLMSDVPLGAFLSGGIDSSIIVALMSEVSDDVKTFSMGFGESSFNELEYARIVSNKFNTEHREFVVEPDAVELLPKLVWHFDEPFADSSAIPTFLVSQLARKFVTVCLSGDGGDELFVGYDRYKAAKVADYYDKLPLIRTPVQSAVSWTLNRLPVSTANKSFVKMARRFVNALPLPREERYADWVTINTDEQKNGLYSSKLRAELSGMDSAGLLKQYYRENKTPDFVANTTYVDLMTYLPDDLLVKVDRMSMANSLEVRVPFIDYNVVQYAMS